MAIYWLIERKGKKAVIAVPNSWKDKMPLLKKVEELNKQGIVPEFSATFPQVKFGKGFLGGRETIEKLLPYLEYDPKAKSFVISRGIKLPVYVPEPGLLIPEEKRMEQWKTLVKEIEQRKLISEKVESPKVEEETPKVEEEIATETVTTTTEEAAAKEKKRINLKRLAGLIVLGYVLSKSS